MCTNYPDILSEYTIQFFVVLIYIYFTLILQILHKQMNTLWFFSNTIATSYLFKNNMIKDTVSYAVALLNVQVLNIKNHC